MNNNTEEMVAYKKNNPNDLWKDIGPKFGYTAKRCSVLFRRYVAREEKGLPGLVKLKKNGKIDTMTMKQKKFAEEYLNNGGNGSQAALKVYNANNRVTADTIARETLKSLRGKEEFQALMAAKGLDNSSLFKKHAELLEDPSPVVRLKALDLAYKLHGSYQQIHKYQFGHLVPEDTQDIFILK